MTHLDNAAELRLTHLQNGSEAQENPPWHLPCGRHSVGWFVVQSHPAAERWARDNLTRLGYQAYLPLYLVSRPDRATPSILHHVLRPLFVSYLFAHLDLRDPWLPVIHAPGVRQLVRAGQQNPIPLAAGLIEALQATDALRATQAPETASWAPGTPCSLRTGIMAGHPAVVLALTNDTARVGLMFLGAMRTFRVPVEYLTPRAQ